MAKQKYITCIGQTSRLEYLKTKFDADLAAADYDARTPLHIAVMQFLFRNNHLAEAVSYKNSWRIPIWETKLF